MDPKICVASNYFFPKGYGGKAVFELCRYLVKRGLEVHVVTSSVKGKPKYELLQGIHVHRIPTHFQKIFNSEYPISPTVLASIMEVIRKYDINLVHINFIFSPLALGTGFLRSIGLIKIPVIVTSHGLTKGYSSTLTEIASNLLGLFSKSLVLHQARAIVTVSMCENNYFKSEFSRKLHYIPNGVDTSIFKPLSENGKLIREKLCVRKDDVLVLYFAHLRSAKGILTLLDAIDVVINETSNVKFLIAGTGPLREKVKKSLKNHEGRVHAFIRYIPDSDLPYLYNASDIYTLPSFVEGMPLSLMEAMACGKPVIATNVSDVPILAKNGVNGIIIPPGNANVLAQSILHLAKNPELRKLMSQANAKKMIEYDWAKIAEQYHLMYSSVIKT